MWGGGSFTLCSMIAMKMTISTSVLESPAAAPSARPSAVWGGGQLALAVTHIMLLCYHLPAACTTSPMVAVRFFLGRVSVSTATSNEHDHDRSAATA